MWRLNEFLRYYEYLVTELATSQQVSLCSSMPPILLLCFEMKHLYFAVDFALSMPKHSNTIVLFLHLSNISRKPHVQMHNSNTKADCTFESLLEVSRSSNLLISSCLWWLGFVPTAFSTSPCESIFFLTWTFGKRSFLLDTIYDMEHQNKTHHPHHKRE